MEQGLAQLADRRKAARAKREHDVTLLDTRVAEADKLLAGALASSDRAIADLNERIAVMDRAVDAYTEEGGGGFLKDDSIRKGQALREQQQDERDQIARDIAHQHEVQDQLRKAHATTLKTIDSDVSGAGDQSSHELAGADDDEKTLRKIRADTVKSIDVQVTAAGDQYIRDEATLDDEEKSLRKSNADNLAAIQSPDPPPACTEQDPISRQRWRKPGRYPLRQDPQRPRRNPASQRAGRHHRRGLLSVRGPRACTTRRWTRWSSG